MRQEKGFSKYFDFVSNFAHLEINLGSESECGQYHERWMRVYGAAMAAWADYDAVMWCVRVRQSLKLCFSATYFALVANQTREQGSLAASYYMAYYASMHAMWAVMYLHPNESVDKITDITHSKMANAFYSGFSQGNTPIIRMNSKELVEDLRFLREYYSYRMPLNPPFGKEEAISKAHASLGGFVKQCIQLANLHSHLIYKAARKAKVSSATVAVDKWMEFQNDFFRINGKEHGSRGLRILDPADKRAEAELLSTGGDLLPISIQYDHMFDEYMTYVREDASEEILRKVRSLVFRALF